MAQKLVECPDGRERLIYVPGDFRFNTKSGIGKDGRSEMKAVDVGVRWDAESGEPMVDYCVKAELRRKVQEHFRDLAEVEPVKFSEVRKTGVYNVGVSILFNGIRPTVKEDISTLDTNTLVARLSPEQIAALAKIYQEQQAQNESK